VATPGSCDPRGDAPEEGADARSDASCWFNGEVTDLDAPQVRTLVHRRPAALTAGWYALVVAVVVNVPIVLWALLMAVLGLTLNDGPWWSWVKAVPFALMMLMIPAALLVAFLWLARRLSSGRPSLLFSGALILVGGAGCLGLVTS
jgi:hypothetical protein